MAVNFRSARPRFSEDVEKTPPLIVAVWHPPLKNALTLSRRERKLTTLQLVSGKRVGPGPALFCSGA
jgi:hypothetical protein